MCKACNTYFASLHVHNQYSALDGFGKPNQFIDVVKSYGQTALGTTNHGNVCGNLKFYQECKANGVKPILGSEIYFEPHFNKEQAKEEKKRGGFSHLTVFAKNNLGFENLNKVITASNREENFYYKPITDWNILKANKEGLIILSGCVLSKIGRYLRAGETEEAIKLIKEFRREFEEDFYLEVMPPFIYEKNASDEDIEFHKFNKAYNAFIVEQGSNLNIPVVMTTDAHFASKDDWGSYRVMRYMAQQEKYPDSHYRYRHLMDAETIEAFWKKYMGTPCGQYLENTGLVVDKCNVDIDFGNSIPKIDWGEPSKDKLIKLAIKGLKSLGKYTPEYKDRLSYELTTVQDKGFEDYFLLVYKICQKSKELDIAQGFGRGSVCGSVLAYSLGITDVDPLIFDISFDRFLRPNKNTTPDIDLDFDSRGQGYIMDYLLNEFSGRASRICTFGQYKTKNLFNDLVKYYKIEDDKAYLEKIKLIIEKEVEENHITDYKELIRNVLIRKFDEKYENFVKHFCRLHGQIKFIGKHAAGVALTDKPFHCYDAIMQTGKEYVTSHDMVQLDSMGIVKMDILGLANLSVVKDIEKITGANRLDFINNHLDDPEIYQAFNDKRTTGIFQFDSWSSAKVLQSVKPANFIELMACNALNRPGPDITPYIEGKANGVDKDSVWYPYTADTYGTVVYQDQLLNICRNVAKLSWDDTDKIVKNTSKKVQENLDKLRPVFVDGCVANGVSKKEALKFYNQNTLYGFPKAHACGYTLFAAYCMWLKLKYPTIFWYALLKNEDKEENREKYMACAIREGILIFPAHLNAEMDFELITSNEQLGFGPIDVLGPGDMAIREGLASIKGLGPKTAEWLMDNRPWGSRENFFEKQNENKRKCNKASVEKLEEHGALDFNFENYIEKTVSFNGGLAKRFKASK